MFKPITLGAIECANRFLMAPLTRCRATAGTHVPQDIVAEHYAQRASAGLLIAEATMVAPNTSAFWMEPGVYSEEQVAAWKKVTDAVHAKGGKIILQIWHGGRAGHPLNNDGAEQVAPSAIAIAHHITGEMNPTGEKMDNALPRALTLEEIPAVVAQFAAAAKNAVAAGFDGVEIHGANGYLIDQFLRSSANQRTDAYGGPLENRARFLLEVVDAVAAAIGKGRVGVRLSPLNSYNSMKDEDPIALTAYVCAELEKRGLAFVHVMRADFFQAQTGDVLTPARAALKTTPLVVNMGYTPEEAEEGVAKGAFDAVAFGTKFLANPDLPERVKAGAKLNDPDPATFYTHDAKGYTDYPFM